MADTSRTLTALQALLADNTSGAISPQNVRDWLVSTNALTGPEIAVTGATTATLGQMHACADSATPANYTLTLPSPTGNAGRFIGARISPTMTKLVTLDAGSGVAIDGQRTRVMWAGESAVLSCDGANWSKVGGRSIPMICQMAPTANGAVASGVNVPLATNSTVIDTTGQMADAANGRVTCLRPSIYIVTTVVRYSNLSAAGRVTGWAWKNGSTATYYAQAEQYGGSGGYPFVWIAMPVTLAAGDYLALYAAQFTGASQTYYADGTQQGSTLSLEEVPTW